jgi:UDPglucose 6-dehydrogenase
MKVGIIGYGVVGRAQEYLSLKLGNETTIIDKLPHEAWADIIENCDIVFICTPEDAVDSVVDEFKNAKGLLVIKSTVPIGTTIRLKNKYGIHVCNNPEFLREANAKSDVMHPKMIVIGQCCTEHGILLMKFYQTLQSYRCVVDPTTSEVVKLTLNAYLSTQLMFWKSIKQLCDKYGVDSDLVAEILEEDNRVSYYGHNPITDSIKGRCLPKDLDQIIKAYEEWADVEPILFKAVKKVNNVHTI